MGNELTTNFVSQLQWDFIVQWTQYPQVKHQFMDRIPLNQAPGESKKFLLLPLKIASFSINKFHPPLILK